MNQFIDFTISQLINIDNINRCEFYLNSLQIYNKSRLFLTCIYVLISHPLFPPHLISLAKNVLSNLSSYTLNTFESHLIEFKTIDVMCLKSELSTGMQTLKQQMQSHTDTDILRGLSVQHELLNIGFKSLNKISRK